jgi:sulfide:quinone oxidoreductase
VEGLLALHAHMQVGVEVHLVSPTQDFVYRPLTVAAPFDLGEVHRFDLEEIASHHGAHLHIDRLAHVDSTGRRVGLASGAELAYDALLVAVGAQPAGWLDGALHFAGADDIAEYRALLARLERGEVQRVCFAIPTGTAWTLPLYELALLTTSHLADGGIIGTELSLVTPEDDPLSMFGGAASRAVRGLLADRGISLRVGAEASEVAGGELRLRDGGSISADQVVTLARLEGPRVPGLPSDAEGFIRVDAHSRVAGLEDVYAAGDGTNHPIKQGGLATQQADAAAEGIVAGLGAALTPTPVRPTLRGMLLTGIAPLYLRSGAASGAGASQQATIDPLWWPPSKIAARYLAPYLASRNAYAGSEELADRPASRQDSARLAASHEEARSLAVTFAERDAADDDFKSALEWLEVIERLDGVLPAPFAAKRTEWRQRTAAPAGRT